MNLSVTVSPPPAPGRCIDWTMAVKNGDVTNYERRVEVVTQASMNIINGDVDLNCEIMTVASKMVDIATETLPLRKVRRRSPYIRNGLLKCLCAKKRATHLLWKQHGCPTSGSCYDDLKNARNDMKNCLRMCRARLERQRIQMRDKQFKSKAIRDF